MAELSAKNAISFEGDVYALDWSSRLTSPPRIAVSTFFQTPSAGLNYVSIYSWESGLDPVLISKNYLKFPQTAVRFIPDVKGTSSDIYCTIDDTLRFWKMDETNKSGSYLARECQSRSPLTAMDWNACDLNTIATASVDSTCTIWDVTTGKCKAKLIAHDNEVFDLCFAPSPDLFASCGADGHIRLFDVRDFDQSYILYEKNDEMGSLIRLRWNPNDHNYIACVSVDSKTVTVLDIRMVTCPIAKLRGHKASVNGICWAPKSPCHLSSCSDDGQVLIWDLAQLPVLYGDSTQVCRVPEPISNFAWSYRGSEENQSDYIAVARGSTVEFHRPTRSIIDEFDDDNEGRLLQ